jgi:DnaJ family protein A protein 2
MVIRQIGSGMIQQAQVHCPSCKGSGSVIADKDKCTSCHGEKTVKEKKTLEVHINKGMKHGEKIVFRGEADEAVSHNKQAAPMPCPSLFFFYFLFPSEALR